MQTITTDAATADFFRASVTVGRLTFQAFGLSKEAALKTLQEGLARHGVQYSLSTDWLATAEYVFEPLSFGIAYRAGAVIPQDMAPVMEVPKYLREFPDYGVLDVTLPLGFTDESWHNDAMPSFAKELPNGYFLKLWIDYADQSKSEVPMTSRFSLGLYNQDMEHITDLKYVDDIADINEFLAAYVPKPTPAQSVRDCSRMSRKALNDWYLENVGYRPDDEASDSDDDLCVAVAEMMFYHAGGTEVEWEHIDAKHLLNWARRDDEQKKVTERRYRCEWSEGYGGAKPEVVGLSFFTGTHSYGSEDKNRITQLAVGEAADLSDTVSVHIVTRIQ